MVCGSAENYLFPYQIQQMESFGDEISGLVLSDVAIKAVGGWIDGWIDGWVGVLCMSVWIC